MKISSLSPPICPLRLLKVERKNPPNDLPIVVYMEAIPENEYPVDKIEELEKGTEELQKRGK